MKFELYSKVLGTLFIGWLLAITSLSGQTYAPIPYGTGFESGSIDANWILSSSPAGGRIQIWNNLPFPTAEPHGGQFHLGMDAPPPGGNFITNRSDMRLNLAGETNVRLTFWWMEWNDETHPEDGVYLSDNGGGTFLKVFDFQGSSTTDLVYQIADLDISTLAADAGLSLTSTFVVRFQQYDNFFFNGGNDGIFIDDIYVSSQNCDLDIPTVSDVIACSPGPYAINASNGGSTISWFDSPSGGSPLATGNTFNTPDLEATTSYYVASTSTSNYTWNFNTNAEEWSAVNECGFSQKWEYSGDDGGSMFASNPNGIATSQALYSPPINVEGTASVDLAYRHRYNTETCCDHGYVLYRVDGGNWITFNPTSGNYNQFDFMYNDPFQGACGNSPDINVYAGDSGGYINSSGTIDLLTGSETLEIVFFFSSDPSFTDEGWYISSVSADLNCESARKLTTVVFPDAEPGPITMDATTCGNGSTTITATSTSNDPTPNFEWFDAPINGSSVGSGSSLTVNPGETTTYWVEEQSNFPSLDLTWTFDNDLENWGTNANCGFTDTWEWVDENGLGAIRAIQSGGNSSMDLFSGAISINGLNNVYFSYKHRYNTETCCDHGYVIYRLDGGDWQFFEPEIGDYDQLDFMYNDPYFGACAFSPDTTVYAGDSNGYLFSGGNINVEGASNIQFQFFYSSDASFTDEGWFIDEISLFGSTSCPSERSPATVYSAVAPSAPDATDVNYCLNYDVSLSAESTAGTDNPYFEWFDTPSGGTAFDDGTSILLSPTSDDIVYVEEKSKGQRIWDFTDNSLLDWSAETTCGFEINNWIAVDDAGTGAAYAGNSNSGNSSMSLISSVISIENSSELEFTFDHRYNTEACCDHGYVLYQLDGGTWEYFALEDYNVFDFMYNDPYLGACGFSPDTSLYAGDSGGYITSTGTLNVNGSSTLRLAFFFSSDASFTDDGWYIDRAQLDGIVLNDCASPRTAVQVTSPTLAALQAPDQTVCPPEFAMLNASSNAGTVDPVIEWYGDNTLANLLAVGDTYETLVGSNTTFYTREVLKGERTWNFDSDAEDFLLSTTCGFESPWTWNDDDGAGTLFARQIGTGNSSMLARTPNVNISQTRGSVELSFTHRYNTEACCDHGYVLYRFNNGNWNFFVPEENTYNTFDFMYNDPIFGGCGFSPDTTVYAGDSNGYITSRGQIEVDGQALLQIAFFYSSDASFADDGWYIDQVSIKDITTPCVGPLTPVDVTISNELDLPSAMDASTCPGGTVFLDATSNSSLDASTFSWHNAAIGGATLGTGETLVVNPASTTTYYVQENGSPDYISDFETGFDNWFSESDCDLPGGWTFVDDGGTGALFAQQNGSGNSSMSLKSPVIPIGSEFFVSYAFRHRFNTETCCDHGYLAASLDGGNFFRLTPTTGPYNNFDFMYNDPYLGACGFSPDIDVYAGDSGGYINSSGGLFTGGSSTIQFAFLYTSDASFVDEGWYIDEFRVNGIFDPCTSPRRAVTVSVESLQSPSLAAASTCIGGSSVLTATSNSSTPNTTFEWYTDAAGNNLIGIGSSFNSPPVNGFTTFYAREILEGQPISLSDDFEGGFDPAIWGLVDGGTADQICGSVSGDALRFGGSGIRQARTQQLNVGTGSINFNLKISTGITADCENADAGEDVILEYSIGGPYTQFAVYDTEDYPDFTAISEPIPEAAYGPNTIFRIRQLANSGVGFDVFAIDDFSISGIELNECQSPIAAVFVSPDQLVAPSTTGDDICQGETAFPTASSNSGQEGAVLEWYTSNIGGFFVGVGEVLPRTQLSNTLTYYVQERVNGNLNYGFTNSFQDWTSNSYCGLDAGWQLYNEGFVNGLVARNETGGNTSMGLSSPVWDIGGVESVDLSFNHLYQTETCCDHGYVLYRLDGGDWELFSPTTNPYNQFDFMYNDPFFGDCGFSPDTTVYAGNSGGSITSSGSIETQGANTLEVQFFWSSDASFASPIGWVINNFTLSGLGSGCVSPRTPVTITVGEPAAPIASDLDVCTGANSELTVNTGAGNTDPTFRWYDAPVNGNLLFEGNPYPAGQVFSEQTVYVEEFVYGSDFEIIDNFSFTTNSNLWSNITANSIDNICGAVDGNALRFNGAGIRLAETLPFNVDRGATIRFALKISQEPTAGCENADVGENVVLEYNTGSGWLNLNTYLTTGFPAFTQITELIPEAALSEATQFRIRQVANSGLDFDVFAIDDFELVGTEGPICRSARVTLTVSPDFAADPSFSILQNPVCFSDMASVTAIPSGDLANSEFRWYASELDDDPLFVGDVFTPNVTMLEQTFYLEEVDPYIAEWDFDSGLEGWNAFGTCGLGQNWFPTNEGFASVLKAENPTGGNTSQNLQSPVVNVTGTSSVNLSYRHRYNTESCCDHGYVLYRLDGGDWNFFEPSVNDYNIFDFMYNDPYFGGCAFSPDTTVYAGDSGGYIESSGAISTTGADELEVLFFFSSDGSFTDDGWYLDNVNLTELGTGCRSDRVAVSVEGRPCCADGADFVYVPDNTTFLGDSYCYLDPTDSWTHFFNSSSPRNLLFSVNGINPFPGNPLAVIYQDGPTSANTAPPVNCDPGSTPPVTYIEMGRVWDFDLNGATLPNGNAQIRFYVPPQEITAFNNAVSSFQSIYADCDYTVDVTEWFKSMDGVPYIQSSYDGSQIQLETIGSATYGTSATPNATNYVELKVPGFSGGGLGATLTSPGVPLPVELIAFEAEKYNKRMSLLTWETETEINNDYFVVERSTDGVDFEEIGEVDGAGTTTIPQSYSELDRNPLLGINYYRLKIVDFEGNFEYSPIRSVTFEASFEISARPNPFVSYFGIDITSDVDRKATIRIFDVAGRLIERRRIEFQTGLQTIDFQTTSKKWIAGMYFIEIETDLKERTVLRVIKAE